MKLSSPKLSESHKISSSGFRIFILLVEVFFLFNFILLGQIDDLTKVEEVIPEKTYRMGETGICGTVESDHIRVTQILPGSVADGKIQKGDLIRGMQHRGMGGWGGIHNLVKKRLYRIGRDWDWHFYVTVERPSLREGKGNLLTYDLHLSPSPGNLCHYGPLGFFAKRFHDHLIVDVVEKGSPSDGVILPGDVIIAVGGKSITKGAYDLFTEAVDRAESEEGKGKLGLTIRRTTTNPSKSDSKTDTSPLNERIDIVLNLKVLGKYGQETPINCLKTKALITQTANQVAKKETFGLLKTELLGLLATGEERYIKVVRDFLRDPARAPWAQAPEDPQQNLEGKGLVSWSWGYRNLLLTEYFLKTSDKSVLPAIAQLSRTLAAGQDQAGLWGHRMCHPELGRAYGYGVMNQPSIPIFISLILAEKCGVKDKVVLEAIKRTHGHYSRWVGQGALPYGNHGPKETEFNNNGTSGSLAVAFALLGDEKGARFYASMAAAASEEVLFGHGGPWWNILWSGLGSNVLGPEMTRAYNKRVHWLRTITRKWDGTYVDLKGWGSSTKGSKTSDTGSHLLNLCASRRSLHITGREMPKSLWVDEKEATSIVEAGDHEEISTTGLLKNLGSDFPPVRLRAAQELAKIDAKVDQEIQKMLMKGSHEEILGALHAIEHLKIEGMEHSILAIATSEKMPLWVRQSSLRVLGNLEAAKPFAPLILRLLVEGKGDNHRGDLARSLGTTLVKLYSPNPYERNLDKDLFYRGILKLLGHKHHTGRAAGMTLLKNIPREDLVMVIDELVHLIKGKDLTYTSYNGAGRQEALEILYNHGIEESLFYTINTIKEPTGRGGPRYRARMRLLEQFGAEAESLIPKISEVLGDKGQPIIDNIKGSLKRKNMVKIKDLKEEATRHPLHFLENPFMR